MNRISMVLALLVTPLLVTSASAADEPIFSGPQSGEKLPPIKLKGIVGKMAEKEFDPVKDADGKPVLLIFVHERTRPAFGLMNAVTRFAATRAKEGLSSSVVFLAEDPTEMEQWVKRVQGNLSKGAEFAISPDGQEGPGVYGLNRNVALTVLVGKDGKTTANFALVQPSVEVDGPKILKAVADVTGGGKVPDIATLAGGGQRPPARMETDPKLGTLVRAVINKQATPEEVEKAAKAVEAYVAENPKVGEQLARIATTVANSGKLENYGTAPAQAKIKEWAEKYGSKKQPERD